MKHQFIVNGKVSLVLMPENELEKHLLKSISGSQIKATDTSGGGFADGSIVIET